MPATIHSTQVPATKVPPTSGWLLLAVLLTGMLLVGHWMGRLPEALPAATARPAAPARPAATPPAAPAATYVTLGYSPTEVALLTTGQPTTAASVLNQ